MNSSRYHKIEFSSGDPPPAKRLPLDRGPLPHSLPPPTNSTRLALLSDVWAHSPVSFSLHTLIKQKYILSILRRHLCRCHSPRLPPRGKERRLRRHLRTTTRLLLEPPPRLALGTPLHPTFVRGISPARPSHIPPPRFLPRPSRPRQREPAPPVPLLRKRKGGISRRPRRRRRAVWIPMIIF